MKTRAITRHASSPDPADAWLDALSSLKSALRSIKSTILRADWVVEEQQMTWAEFLKLIGKTRRNYFRQGVALDPDYNVAFTESELNANAMIYRDGKEGSKYCVVRPKRFEEYYKIRFDRDCQMPAPDEPVVVFTTVGMFISDDDKTPLPLTGTGLDAGHREISPIDEPSFLQFARNGAAYLAKEVQKNGRFIYGHYPCFDKVVPGYNTLRHFSSIFAMLDVYETYGRIGNSTLGAAINKALRYGIDTFIKHRTLDDGSDAAYPIDLEDDEIKLGALGVTLLALVKHAELMKTKKNLPLMESIARGIYSMQNPDGSFVHVLNAADYSVKEPFRIVYYDGEAVFGMMRLYSITKDDRLRAASELAFKRFIATDHWENHDHWLSYAVNELTTYEPKREYFKFGINNFLSFLPFIYHRDTQFPTLLELMMAADTMLERMKSMPEMSDLLSKVPLDDFYAAMESRAKNLLNGYFYPELAMFFKNPRSIVGSFFIRHHAFRVRIDDVEHFLSAFVAYRRYLARRDHEPQPSKELLEGKAEGTGMLNRQMSDKPSTDNTTTIESEIESPKEKVSSPPPVLESNVDIESFAAEFKREKGVIFFMLRSIKPKAAGIEFAAFRRARLFKNYFGCEPYFLTHEYQNDVVEQLTKYGLDNPILNMYDHFQGIDRATEPDRIAQLPPISADCQVHYVESNVRVLRNERLLMYCIFDPDNQKLRYINFFENGKKIRRDTYDSLGFLSRRQTLEPTTGLPTEALYYRPDGSIAAREFYKIVENKSVLQSMERLARDGNVAQKFSTHEEAIAQWVFELVDSDRRTHFIIGDRTPEYTDAYVKLKQADAQHAHVIHHLHSIHYNLKDGKTRARHQYLLTDRLKSDAILTLTNRQREDIVERYHLNNVVTIPHALPRLESEPRTVFDPFRVVQAGRFSEEKGHAKSIEAFKRVLEKIPRATLHFYGSGGLQEEIQARIAAEGLERSVLIEGFCDNMPAVFANSALSLFPSTFEGFGLVVSESLQQGCPVVAFDCNYGPSDMIEDGVNGYLVPVGDVDALAERIIKILSDEALQQKMSAAAARSVEKFSQPKIAEQWARLFHALTHKGVDR